MFTNYLMIAFRNILRFKVFSIINILGLAIGLTCCILIFLWVEDELSYDKFNVNADRLYYAAQTQTYSDGGFVITTCTPAPLAAALKAEYPEIENTARLSGFEEKQLVSYGSKSFNEIIRLTDNSLFSMFSFPLVKGDSLTVLTQPFSIAISEDMAKKFFRDEDPLGKVLKVRNKYDFKVTGVFKNIPRNSSERFDFLAPFEFYKESGRNLEAWGSNAYDTMILLKKGANPDSVSAKISDRLKQGGQKLSVLYLHPLLRAHLYSLSGKGGAIKYVYIFTLIAIFILLIACFNFMNLATTRSEKRAKEIAVRKVSGAQRIQLISQFLCESLISSILALLIAIALAELMLPTFNDLAWKKLTLDLFSPKLHLLWMAAAAVVTGLIAGSYPAFALSSFKPAQILKGFSGQGKGILMRKILVVFQFTLSIFLIISSSIIYNQIMFMRNKDLGLNRDNVLYISTEGLAGEKYISLKNELLKNPNIEAVTAGSHLPTLIGSNTGGWDWEGKDPNKNILIGYTITDFDYTKTFSLEMLEGRDFSAEFSLDSTKSLILNESAAKLTGIDNPIGKRISCGGDDFTIISIMKDFNFLPLNNGIEPMAFFFYPPENLFIFMKLKGENISHTVDDIGKVFSKYNPNYPFDYKFLDEEYDSMYRYEKRMGNLFKYFTILAIFISCLGLYGLTAFTTERRTKEIGVRKVLGASEINIIIEVSRGFMLLVAAANLTAWPLAYYFMQKWLENYAYRIETSLWYFLFGGLTAVIIAMLTIGIQAYRAASANPVASLKYE